MTSPSTDQILLNYQLGTLGSGASFVKATGGNPKDIKTVKSALGTGFEVVNPYPLPDERINSGIKSLQPFQIDDQGFNAQVQFKFPVRRRYPMSEMEKRLAYRQTIEVCRQIKRQLAKMRLEIECEYPGMN